MKIRTLAITLFIIGITIACKKELNSLESNSNNQKSKTINSNSLRTSVSANKVNENERERIQNSILNITSIKPKYKKQLIDGIVIENGKIKGIKGGAKIMEKLNDNEIILFYRTVLPNARLEVYDRTRNKYIIDDFNNKSRYSNTNSTGDYIKKCWRSEYPARYDSCSECGEDQCFMYLNC